MEVPDRIEPGYADTLRGAVFGKSGTGKSWLLHWIIANYLKYDLRDRVIVLNTTIKDYSYLSGYDIEKISLDQSSPEQLNWEKILLEHPRLYIELLSREEAGERHIDNLCRTVLGMGNTFLAVDEGHAIFPKYSNADLLYAVIREGRKHGIDYMLGTQQPVDLATTAMGLANMIISFRIDKDTHVEKIGDRIGAPYSEIQNLENYEYFVFNDAESGLLHKEKSTGLNYP